MAIGLVLTLVLSGNLWTLYLLILMTRYPQILVLEGLSLRQAWTRSRQLSTGAGWRLVGILIVLTVAGMLVLEVGLAKAGQWAEVLGSGLTNLLCMVGVTGVYWEVRGREEGTDRSGYVFLPWRRRTSVVP